jgi:iron complex outermembrane receptor protein
MTTHRKPSLRVLHAAVVLALSQSAFMESALAEPAKEPETKLAQATESKPSADNVQLAQAGGAPAASSGASATKAESIVVTARRREELIQDVPGAVSSFSGAQIEQAGIQDVTGLADLTPNTTLKPSRATNTTLTAFIRGIGQQDPVAGYEQGVGIYLDDVYLARPQGALQDIYDLARIEILRGPQGTLYGRNTIGGAVKYVSKRLSDRPELNVKVALGEHSQQDLVVRGNLPVTDTFRIGATIGTFNHDGYGTNVANGRENYNKEILAGRISAEFTPTRDLFIRLAADRTQDDSLPKAGYRLTPGPALDPVPPLSGDYDTRANLYTVLGKEQEVTNSGESLLIEYNLSPELTFKSITAHRKGESVAPIDFDSLNSTQFEAPALYHDSQRSQEFQLVYSGSRWQGVAGAYFMKANAFNEFDVLLRTSAAGGLSLYTMDDIDTNTWAIFADLNYEVTPTLDVSFGLRYTSDEREARIFKRTYLGLAGSPTLGNPNAIPALPADTDLGKDQLNRSDEKVTPKLGVGWKFTPGQNLYLTYAEGFKGGMFDPRMSIAAAGGINSPTGQQVVKGVEPEEVKSTELGLKSSFDGGRIQTNVAAFYMDYKNVQIPGSIPTFNAAGQVTGFAGFLTNAGKAKVMGLELEGIARITDRFTLQAMAGFINAEYKEWIVANGQTGANAALVNVASSAEFQNTPERQASITGTYEWPMGLFGKSGGLVLQGTAAYKSKVYQSEFVRPTGVPAIDVVVPQNQMLAQDAFTLYDASLIWTSRDRRWSAGIVARNLTDERYKVAGYAFGAFSNSITTFYGEPRSVKFVGSVTF